MRALKATESAFASVLLLRTLVPAFHHDAGRQVGNTDSGVGGVNADRPRRKNERSRADPPG